MYYMPYPFYPYVKIWDSNKPWLGKEHVYFLLSIKKAYKPFIL